MSPSNAQHAEGRLLTIKEVAAMLRMSEDSVRREIRNGHLAAKQRLIRSDPKRKPTPRMFVQASEAERYIDDMEQISQTAPKRRARAVRRAALAGVSEFV